MKRFTLCVLFLGIVGTYLSAQINVTIPDCVDCATVTALDCGSATLSPTTYPQGGDYNGVLTVPYTGGNGGNIPALSIASTGVTGLTADAIAGTIANGAGTLFFCVSGTPSGPGTVSFDINFGGQACTANLNITEDATGSGGGPGLAALGSGSGACYLGNNTKHQIIYEEMSLAGNSSFFTRGYAILNGQYFDDDPKGITGDDSDSGLAGFEGLEFPILDAESSKDNQGSLYQYLLTDGQGVLVGRLQGGGNQNLGCGNVETYRYGRPSISGWFDNQPVPITLDGSSAKPLKIYGTGEGFLLYADDGEYYGYGTNWGALGTTPLTFSAPHNAYWGGDASCNGNFGALRVPENESWGWDNAKPHPDSIALSTDFAVWVKSDTVYFRGRDDNTTNVWSNTMDVQKITMPGGVGIKQMALVGATKFLRSQNPAAGDSNCDMVFILGDDGNMYWYWLDGNTPHRSDNLEPYPGPWLNGSGITGTTENINAYLVPNFFPSGIAEIMNLDGDFTDYIFHVEANGNTRIEWDEMPWIFRLNNGDVAFCNAIGSSLNTPWSNLNTMIPSSQVAVDNSTLQPTVIFKQAFYDANFKQVFAFRQSGYNHNSETEGTPYTSGFMYWFVTQSDELWASYQPSGITTHVTPYVDEPDTGNPDPNNDFELYLMDLGAMMSLYPTPCFSGEAGEIFLYPSNN